MNRASAVMQVRRTSNCKSGEPLSAGVWMRLHEDESRSVDRAGSNACHFRRRLRSLNKAGRASHARIHPLGSHRRPRLSAVGRQKSYDARRTRRPVERPSKLLVLWLAYVAVIWSTSAVQGGSGALLLLWVFLLLPCGYVTWRWFRSASD